MSTMTAVDVREALASYWPEESFLHVYEAPLDPGRQGTKIDVLVCALWKSKGYERHAVEVKVSYSDWKNEIERVEFVSKAPGGSEMPHTARHYAERWVSYYGGEIERRVIPTTAKSEEWRRHAHRFWVAAPTALANRIRSELPAGWGLLAVAADGQVFTVVRARRTDPEPLKWTHVIGILRAGTDCGTNALRRAEQRGYQRAIDARREVDRLQRLRDERNAQLTLGQDGGQ